MIIIPGGDQLMANVCGRPGVPRSRGDPCGLGQDVVTAIGNVSEFLDRFIKAAAFGGVPHGGAMKGTVKQLILGAHTPAYRMEIRLLETHVFLVDL
jgi:hypothetical protein